MARDQADSSIKKNGPQPSNSGGLLQVITVFELTVYRKAASTLQTTCHAQKCTFAGHKPSQAIHIQKSYQRITDIFLFHQRPHRQECKFFLSPIIVKLTWSDITTSVRQPPRVLRETETRRRRLLPNPKPALEATTNIAQL